MVDGHIFEYHQGHFRENEAFLEYKKLLGTFLKFFEKGDFEIFYDILRMFRKFDLPNFWDRKPSGGAVCTTFPTAGYTTDCYQNIDTSLYQNLYLSRSMNLPV